MAKYKKFMSVGEVAGQIKTNVHVSACADHLSEFEKSIQVEIDAIQKHLDNLEEMRDRLDSLIGDVTSSLDLLNSGVDKLSEAQQFLSRDV